MPAPLLVLGGAALLTFILEKCGDDPAATLDLKGNNKDVNPDTDVISDAETTPDILSVDTTQDQDVAAGELCETQDYFGSEVNSECIDVSDLGDTPAQGETQETKSDVKAEATTPSASKYTCLLTASDSYGMVYGNNISSLDSAVVPQSNGWKGMMWFKAASGTPESIEEQLKGLSSDWPQEKQSIPDGMGQLYGKFDVVYSSALGTVKITNMNIAGNESDTSLFPMTWTITEKGQEVPEAVKPDYSNLVYVSSVDAVSVPVTCKVGTPADCDFFQGKINKGDIGMDLMIGMDQVDTFTVECQKK